MNLDLDGKQTVVTHTIGFGIEEVDSDGNTVREAEGVLLETANQSVDEYGRIIGKYQYADNGATLAEAISNSLRNLAAANDTLTSASVAANNFDRTQTLNAVYYAMFDPQLGTRWQGNLKKYQVKNGLQVGTNGKLAVDPATGHFSTQVQSFWSKDIDGNRVASGGVVDWYRSATARKIYTDLSGSLQEFNKTNLVNAGLNLETELDVASENVDEMLDWITGKDVDDENNDGKVTDYRPDTFGDPLHSKPLVVNYGNSIRILVGTNAGALHMFEDKGATVSENWAFMPSELLDIHKSLRQNDVASSKVYGIDGKITSYVKDYDGDGIIESGDKVYIFFGLRRGGSSYYALDISSPGNQS